MSDTLQHAYDSALAVLSAPVSFVEWTTLKVDSFATPDPRLSDDWSPIGLSLKYRKQDYEWDVVQKIEGERYIYVFARRTYSNDVPTLVEELRLAADGTIYSAPHPLEGGVASLPDKRKWNKIGKTMRFVRRLRASMMSHYFFATRIPLTRPFVKELQKNVTGWVPETQFDDLTFVQPKTSGPDIPNPTTFGEWDLNVFTGLGPGALQAAVLDPITIALHLHDLAVSATDDLYDYATIYDGQSEQKRERVIKRQQKLVLAYVVRMVLKNYDKGPGVVSYRTNRYIQQYWEQIDYRVKEKERWWRYLGNWYQSDPIEFLSRAHFVYPNQHWISFFLPMLLCLIDANSSDAGRAMLDIVVKNKSRWKWLHQMVLPGLEIESEEDTKAEKYQVPRKFLLAILETVKELGSHFLDQSTASMWRVLGAHSKHFNVRFMIDYAPMDEDPLKAAEQFEHSQNKLGIEVPESKEIVEEWHELAEHGYVGKTLKLMTVVEVIDLMLSVRQFFYDRSLDHTLTMMRSMADTSALLLEFAHGAKGKLLEKLFRSRPGVIAVAAILEGIVAVREALHAAAKDDDVGVAAAGFTVAGSAVTLLGVVGAVGLELTPTPFFVFGLILMGIGAIIGFFKDDPMDTFLKFCAFGKDGGGGEIVEGLEEMKKGEYGQQIEVLINLLCRFKLEDAEDALEDDGALGPLVAMYFPADPRDALFTMGWIPDGAKLVVEYYDKWGFGPGAYRGDHYHYKEEGHMDKTTRTFEFGKGGVQLTKDRYFTLRLTKARHFDPLSTDPNDDHSFEAHFAAQLHVAFGDFKFVVPPKPSELKLVH